MIIGAAISSGWVRGILISVDEILENSIEGGSSVLGNARAMGRRGEARGERARGGGSMGDADVNQGRRNDRIGLRRWSSRALGWRRPPNRPGTRVACRPDAATSRRFIRGMKGGNGRRALPPSAIINNHERE